MAGLAAALKQVVKGRELDGFTVLKDLASAAELPDGWVCNAVQGNLLDLSPSLKVRTNLYVFAHRRLATYWRNGLTRIIRKGSDFGSQDGVIVSRTKDRTLPLSSAGHVGRKIGRMARCERPAGQLRRGRSREAR